MTLSQGLLAGGVVFGILWVIMAKVATKNPGFRSWIQRTFTGGIYIEPPKINPLLKDRLEQVYDEKRSMM